LSARDGPADRHGARTHDRAGPREPQRRLDRVHEPARSHGVSAAAAGAAERDARLMATPGLSVWVVDDDESVRWVLEQALKQAQMIPRSFDAGRTFFAALERDRPDVIVTDIRMPDMSGLELME